MVKVVSAILLFCSVLRKMGTHYHSLGSSPDALNWLILEKNMRSMGNNYGYFPVVREKVLIPKVTFLCVNGFVFWSIVVKVEERGFPMRVLLPSLPDKIRLRGCWFLPFLVTEFFARKNNIASFWWFRCILLLEYCCQTTQVDQNEILYRVLETCCVRCYSCLVWRHVFDF